MAFDSLEWLYVTGRGWVAVVQFEGTAEDYEPVDLIGEKVYVDGWEFKVRGVEKTMRGTSPEHPYRGKIGLLVP